VASITAIYIEH